MRALECGTIQQVQGRAYAGARVQTFDSTSGDRELLARGRRLGGSAKGASPKASQRDNSADKGGYREEEVVVQGGSKRV